MKACGFVVACVLCLAATASAHNAKVYISVQAEGADGFQAASQTLLDSVRDLRHAIKEWQYITETDRRTEAALDVRITGREEVQGELRVHVHVTTRDGLETDLTGASVHQWKQAAKDIARQLSAWAHGHGYP
jgi:hypothetical protein